MKTAHTTSTAGSGVSVTGGKFFEANEKQGRRAGIRVSVFLLFASLWISGSAAFAADEICPTCGQEVRVNGEFAHRKDNAPATI